MVSLHVCIRPSDFLGFSGAGKSHPLVSGENLARAGGVYRIGSDCCEDAALARNIKAVGLKVALSDRPVLQPVGINTLSTFGAAIGVG